MEKGRRGEEGKRRGRREEMNKYPGWGVKGSVYDSAPTKAKRIIILTKIMFILSLYEDHHSLNKQRQRVEY